MAALPRRERPAAGIVLAYRLGAPAGLRRPKRRVRVPARPGPARTRLVLRTARLGDGRPPGPQLPRRKLARWAGIKAGFAIPVRSAEETIAVIEFFVFDQRKADKRLIQLVTAVAAQLGEIIQRRVAEEALKRSRYELEAETRERLRVARELHDGVTQLLGTTMFRLRGLEEGASERDPEPIRRVRGLLEQAIGEVRRISTNLAPDVLEQLGLCAAVRVLARDLQEKTGASVGCGRR